MRGRAGRPPVYRITGSRLGRSEDVRGRERRYLLSMSVRTSCFVLAVVADGWLRWALFAGAILLPYIAVVFANAGREQPDPVPVTVLHSGRRALEPGLPSRWQEQAQGWPHQHEDRADEPLQARRAS